MFGGRQKEKSVVIPLASMHGKRMADRWKRKKRFGSRTGNWVKAR